MPLSNLAWASLTSPAVFTYPVLWWFSRLPMHFQTPVSCAHTNLPAHRAFLYLQPVEWLCPLRFHINAMLLQKFFQIWGHTPTSCLLCKQIQSLSFHCSHSTLSMPLPQIWLGVRRTQEPCRVSDCAWTVSVPWISASLSKTYTFRSSRLKEIFAWF